MCVFGRVLSFPSKVVVDAMWTVVLSSQVTVYSKHITSRCFTFGRVLSFPSSMVVDAMWTVALSSQVTVYSKHITSRCFTFGRVLSFPSKAIVDRMWTVVLSSQLTVYSRHITSRCFNGLKCALNISGILEWCSKAGTTRRHASTKRSRKCNVSFQG